MRKWLLLAAFGLLMQPASATTVTKKIDVPEFTGIVAGSVYDVTLIRSDGCSVEVSYDTRFEDCVRVFVSDGNLVLEFMQPERGRKSRSFDMKDVKLSAVVRMPELTYLRLSGASKLTTGDEFDAGARFDGGLSGASSARGLSVSAGRGELRLSGASSADLKARFDEAFLMQLSGASNASVDVRSDDVRMTGSGASNVKVGVRDAGHTGVRLSGASQATVSGETVDLNVECSGAARSDATALTAQHASVSCSGAGSADVEVTGELSVVATGGSSVVYGGDAAIVSQSVGRGASLRKR